MSRRVQLVRWIQGVRDRADFSIAYAHALEATPASDRQGWPGLRRWRRVLCWLRGHRWPSIGGAFEICAHRLSWCERCREEIAGRVAWEQLELAPIGDEDLPWLGFDDEADDR